MYRDLVEFLMELEKDQQLHRIQYPVSPNLEITEICCRCLAAQGPALLFENPQGFKIPVLANLFGTPERIARAMGVKDLQGVRELGRLLAELREPKAPQNWREAWESWPLLKKALTMAPKLVSQAACQEVVLRGAEIDLSQYPIQTCWPNDAGPLITWGLVVTKGPQQARQNMGIYRQQVIAKNKVIMRWLAHRGGALDYQQWCAAHPGQPFPVSVILGADPATILAAVTPIPDQLSEFSFAGLLRGSRSHLVNCLSNSLQVSANSEIVLEGYIYPGETAPEGPFGDHTGYYNEVQEFPVFTIECITQKARPIYHSTYTGRPPDEPAILGVVLNELLIPILTKQFPEIVDFYLPPEGCSYRMAIATIKKAYPGHAKRVMCGIWSFLRQFMYTKFIIVTDDDIDARDWKSVIWALTTRMDPQRDTVFINNTPIDYLDFASPEAGLGSKIGFDATNKWPAETSRIWGETIEMSPQVKQKIDEIWQNLGLNLK